MVPLFSRRRGTPLHYSLKLIRANDNRCTVMRCNSKINCSKQFFRHVIILAPLVFFFIYFWGGPTLGGGGDYFFGLFLLFGFQAFLGSVPSPRDHNANARSQRFSYATSQIAVPALREPLICNLRWGCQLAEEHDEQNILSIFDFEFQFAGYYKETICMDLFCMGVLHGFFARIFRTDFVARIFWCGLETTCWEAPKIFQENSLKHSPCFGGFWDGLGRQEGEAEIPANLTKARVSDNWVVFSWHAKSRRAERGRPEQTMN